MKSQKVYTEKQMEDERKELKEMYERKERALRGEIATLWLKLCAAAIREQMCVRDEHYYNGHDFCLNCGKERKK